MDPTRREPKTPPETGLADPRDLIAPPDAPQPLPLPERLDTELEEVPEGAIEPAANADDHPSPPDPGP